MCHTSGYSRRHQVPRKNDFDLLLPFLIDELFRGVGLGEWNVRRLDFEKIAQRSPAVAEIESEKAIWRNFRLYFGDMLPEDPDGMVAVRQAVIEDLDFDRLVPHLADRVHMR